MTEKLKPLRMPHTSCIKGYDPETRHTFQQLKHTIKDIEQELKTCDSAIQEDAAQHGQPVSAADGTPRFPRYRHAIEQIERLVMGMHDLIVSKQEDPLVTRCSIRELHDYPARCAIDKLCAIYRETKREEFREFGGDYASAVEEICKRGIKNILRAKGVDIFLPAETLLKHERPEQLLFASNQMIGLQDRQSTPNYRPQLRKLITLAQQGIDEWHETYSKTMLEPDRMTKRCVRDMEALISGTYYTTYYKDKPAEADNPFIQRMEDIGVLSAMRAMFNERDVVVLNNIRRDVGFGMDDGMNQYIVQRQLYQKLHDLQAQEKEVARDLFKEKVVRANPSIDALHTTVFYEILWSMPQVAKTVDTLLKQTDAGSGSVGETIEHSELFHLQAALKKFLPATYGNAPSRITGDDVDMMLTLFDDDMNPPEVNKVLQETGLDDFLAILHDAASPPDYEMYGLDMEKLAKRFDEAVRNPLLGRMPTSIVSAPEEIPSYTLAPDPTKIRRV